jgi:ribonuclease BN (tRNA processing enzyme)
MMKSLLCIAIIALAAAPPQTTVPSMRVVLLGTGTPGADPDRWGPAVAIVAGDQSYLVDAGPGVVRRAAAAARERQLPALTAARLTRVFITHLHSDHTLGLPDLMLSPWVLGRPVPLDVYGPKGIAEMASSVEHAYQADIDMRLHGGEPQTTQNYHAVTHDVAAGPVYRDALVTVDAIAVAHGTWAEAFGYRFRGDGRTVVISGDTRPTDALVDACRGCDVLVHEVYSAAKLPTQPPAWQTYHKAFHTSTVELAQIAGRARPKLLVLYHQLFWGASDADLIREIRDAGYAGAVTSGADLDIF